jgi:hypothetical protein
MADPAVVLGTPPASKSSTIASACTRRLATEPPWKLGARTPRRLHSWVSTKLGQDHLRRAITTLSIAIDVDRGVFVGMDPLDCDGAAEIERLRASRQHVDRALATGWHAWERDRADEGERVEILVGFTAGNFLRYVCFEREAPAEEAGERHALAER